MKNLGANHYTRLSIPVEHSDEVLSSTNICSSTTASSIGWERPFEAKSNFLQTHQTEGLCTSNPPPTGFTALSHVDFLSGLQINIVIETNLHRIYNVSRGLIITFVLLYCAFAYADDQGWELHYITMAFCLSLLAQFKAKPSVVFLAVSTGVWVQGLGAYGVEFLCINNKTMAEKLAED